jgi:hypothetical protein
VSVQWRILVPRPANIPGPTKLAALKQQFSIREPSDEQRRGSSPQPEYATAFLDNLTSTVDSGNLFAQRQLTVADMMDYATRNYRNARTAELLQTGANRVVGRPPSGRFAVRLQGNPLLDRQMVGQKPSKKARRGPPKTALKNAAASHMLRNVSQERTANQPQSRHSTCRCRPEAV